MSEFINEIAKIEVPQDIVNHVDIKGLLENFRKNFKRLDEFRDTRDQHEKRGVGKKIWDFIRMDETLEDAQLDAVAVQADFSKAIGQLMVLSIMLSQKLDEQQLKLASQQETIKKQTIRIEDQTLSLEEQQQKLEQQNLDLEKLVNDFFELKGLTQEEAKKLIDIANDVKSIKVKLIASVEASLSDALAEVKTTIEDTLAALEKSSKFVSLAISEAHENFNKKLQEQTDEVDRVVKTTQEKTLLLQDEFRQERAELEKKQGIISDEMKSLQTKQTRDYESVEQTLRKYIEKATTQEDTLCTQDKMISELNTGLQKESEISTGLLNKLDDLVGQIAEHKKQSSVKIRNLNLMLGLSFGCLFGLVVFVFYH